MGIGTNVEKFVGFFRSKPKPEQEQEEFNGTKTSYNEQEALMNDRETTKRSKIYGGINETAYVKFKDDGGGVFKPGDGEVCRDSKDKDFLPGYKCERAAYLVSRFLNFDLVPPTVIRTVGNRIGSVQEFIEDTKTINETKEGHDLPKSKVLEFQKMWLFDLLILNDDRHSGNFLITGEEGKENVIAIDHGYSFAPTSSLPGFGDFYCEDISSDLVDKISSFSDGNEKEILRDLLDELLPKEIVKKFMERLRYLANALKERPNISGKQGLELINI